MYVDCFNGLYVQINSFFFSKLTNIAASQPKRHCSAFEMYKQHIIRNKIKGVIFMDNIYTVCVEKIDRKLINLFI